MATLNPAEIGLPEILLWLLTYAIVYGVLAQVEIPKSKSARSVIAIVSGFLVLMSQPAEILTVLSQMAGDMLLIIIGILVLLVLLEVSGFKTGEHIVGETYKKHIFLVALILIAVAIFVSAGGLQLLGWSGAVFNIDWNTIFFLIIVIAAIAWMASEGGGKGEGKGGG